MDEVREGGCSCIVWHMPDPGCRVHGVKKPREIVTREFWEPCAGKPAGHRRLVRERTAGDGRFLSFQVLREEGPTQPLEWTEHSAPEGAVKLCRCDEETLALLWFGPRRLTSDVRFRLSEAGLIERTNDRGHWGLTRKGREIAQTAGAS